MKLHFFSPPCFEPWDWRNPDTVGIGGSETGQIEMAWRMARRGYDVTCYAPIPADGPRDLTWRGTKWLHTDQCDFSEPGVWILSRCPEALDRLTRPDQQAWLICQDEDYHRRWTPERLARVDRVVALCNAQAQQFLARYPELRAKVCVSSNGLKPELVEQVLQEQIDGEDYDSPLERNPKRLMYASSPDRALVPLLKIFERAREFVPDLELHVCYGFDNIDKIVELATRRQAKGDPQFLAKVADLKRALTQPGIVRHGRLNQADLYREWAKTGIWVYPNSDFRETSCITCMEAQALGAVPITSPLWAVAENVAFGGEIAGDAHRDSLTQARFVTELVRLATDPLRQETIRSAMMPEARRMFTWERFCDGWEAWIHGYANGSRATEQQHAFHLRHARGKILNVGCNDDAGDLRSLGALNVDCQDGDDAFTGRKVKADLIMDARDLCGCLVNQFDTVVLGGILEHLTDIAAEKTLREARRTLRKGGQILITCPEDYRGYEVQHRIGVDGKTKVADQRYTDGVYAYHWRPTTREIIAGWLKAAGLVEKFHRPIDYGFAWGHGIIAVDAREAERERFAETNRLLEELRATCPSNVEQGVAK